MTEFIEQQYNSFQVKINDVRGKKRECDICKKDFNLLTKEHQCKRCKRAVCSSCSLFKRPVYRLRKFSDIPHRCCKNCKEEGEKLLLFIDEVKPVFGKDTLSKDWLKALENTKSYQEISNEYFEYLNDTRLDEKFKSGDEIDLQNYNNFKTSEKNILNQSHDFFDSFNYSLQEFFHFVIGKTDQTIIMTQVRNIMKAFISKNMKFGFSESLKLFIIFILCFASEPAAFKIVDLFYCGIYPKTLYPKYIKQTGVKKSEIENSKYINTISQMLSLIYKVNQNELLSIQKYLDEFFMRLSDQMTINAMTFENTFFIIDETIKKNTFSEYLKCLAVIGAIKYFDHYIKIKKKRKEQIQEYRLDAQKIQEMILRNLENEKIKSAFRDLENMDEKIQNSLNEKLAQELTGHDIIQQEQLQLAIEHSEQYQSLERSVKKLTKQNFDLQEEIKSKDENHHRLVKEAENQRKIIATQTDTIKQLKGDLMQQQMLLEETQKKIIIVENDDPNSGIVLKKYQYYEAQIQELKGKFELRMNEFSEVESVRQNLFQMVQKLQEENRVNNQIISDLSFQNQDLDDRLTELEGRSRSRSRQSTLTQQKNFDQPINPQIIIAEYKKSQQKLDDTQRKLDQALLEFAESKLQIIRSQRLYQESEYERNTLSIQSQVFEECYKKEQDLRAKDGQDAEMRLKNQYKKMYDSIQLLFEQNDQLKIEKEELLSKIEKLQGEIKKIQQNQQNLQIENEKLRADTDEFRKMQALGDKWDNEEDPLADYLYLEKEGDENRRRIFKDLFQKIKNIQQELRFKNIDQLIKKEYLLALQLRVKQLNESLAKKSETVEELLSQNDLIRTQFNVQGKFQEKSEERKTQLNLQKHDEECNIF